MKTKYKFGAILLIFFLFGSILGYTLAQSGNTFIISEGVYSGAPDYTFWREGSNYYAKNDYGAIDSGTNFAILINTVINTVNETIGAEFYIKAGNYTIIFPINMTKERVEIIGAGTKLTVLYLGDNANVDIIQWFTTDENVKGFNAIKNLHIQGNKANNVNGSGIHLEGATWDFRLEDVWILEMPEYGIRTSQIWGHKYINVIVEESGKAGGWFHGNHGFFSGGRFANNGEEGINAQVRRTTFIGIEFQQNNWSGLDIGGYGASVGGEQPTNHSDTKVIGSTFKANGLTNVTNRNSQLRLSDNATGVIVTSNTFDGYQIDVGIKTSYGIWFFGSSAVNNTVANNEFKYHDISAISGISGFNFLAENNIHDNIGYATEQRGKITVISGTWYLHNLTTTPDVILLTVENSTAYFAQSGTANTTHFRIYIRDDAGNNYADPVDVYYYIWVGRNP